MAGMPKPGDRPEWSKRFGRRRPLVGGLTLALLVGACGERWPDAAEGSIVLRVEVADRDAAMISYRVWDERHELVRDELLLTADFPRFVELFAAEDDPTPSRFRGSVVEIETWTEQLCPRTRVTHRYRLGSSPSRNVVEVPAPVESEPCHALFVAESGSDDDDCTQEEPCRELERALAIAREESERFVIHVEGNATFQPFGMQRRMRMAELPDVIRAWPGRSLPELPTFDTVPGEFCDPDASNPCNNNSICFENRCVSRPPISFCCDMGTSERGPDDLELDGIATRGGKFGIEINGATNVTVRNCQVQDAGGGLPRIPTSGIRVHRSPGTLLEHNLVQRSVDRSGRGIEPAYGILVDGGFAMMTAEITAATLQFNRVEGASQDGAGGGLYVNRPEGTVTLRGNTWCRNRIAAIKLVVGDSDINVEHDLFADNEADVDVDGYEGQLSLSGSTLTSGVRGVPDGAFERTAVAADTVAAPGTRPVMPELVDCLIAPNEGDFGVCRDFPNCP